MSSQNDGLNRLVLELQTQLSLEECASVEQLLSATDKKIRFVRNRRVRIAEYYDLTVPIIIYDQIGGTLGLVETIPDAADEAGPAVQRAIDQAAAVRQILIEHSNKGLSKAPGRSQILAAQVELILVIDNPEAVRRALTDIARKTTYLRLIGLSVVRWKDDGFPDLHRAFPWLLSSIKRWFERQEFLAPTDLWRKDGDAVLLELQEYRSAGIRQFHCHAECNLQLVHGPNGSGKSSLAEALELLLTDRVQRLDEGGQNNYFFSLRYRPPGMDDEQLKEVGPASVALKHGEQLISSVAINNADRQREGKLPDGSLRVNSFRIDQVFMDKLVRNKPDARAALFLDAFSPTESDLLPKMERLQTSVRNAIAELPQHVRERTPAEELQQIEWVLREFGWLRPPKDSEAQEASGLDSMAIEAMLPIPSGELRRLSVLQPAFARTLDTILEAKSREDLVAAFSAFDESLGALVLAARAALVPLRTALRIFEEFRNWRAVGQIARGSSIRQISTFGWISWHYVI